MKLLVIGRLPLVADSRYGCVLGSAQRANQSRNPPNDTPHDRLEQIRFLDSY
jgi:hypothetical protein